MKEKLNVVISCGPTREPIDPVRFISNYSTGTFGLTLARLCSRLGHNVTVAHGPMEIPADLKVKKIPFETVLDLQGVLTKTVPDCDVLFMVAAVSDFKPLEAACAKIKKNRGGGRFLNLSLVENPDVLKSLRRFKDGKVFVGFSLESKNLYENSLRKLREKDLDLVVAQKVNEKLRPFGRIAIDALVIDRNGRRREFHKVSKEALSKYLLEKVLEIRSAAAR